MTDFLYTQLKSITSVWPFFAAGLFIIGSLTLHKYRYTRHRYKPLEEVYRRRPAGLALAEKRDEVSSEFGYYIGISLGVPGFPFLFNFMLGGTTGLLYFLCCVAAVLEILLLKHLLKQIKMRWKYQVGYLCEVLVAVELDQLMKQGYEVFHDVQMDGFNIDHLVIGRNGIFAIETKGRRKVVKKGNNGELERKYRLEPKGDKLVFPTWTETKPVEQAVRQAQQVSTWLSSALGYSVKAEPVLVFPGWYIERKQRTAIPVCNHKELLRHFPAFRGMALSPDQIRQIVYQVEQLNTMSSRIENAKVSKFGEHPVSGHGK